MCGELAAVKSTNEASNVSEYRPWICLNGFKAINILPAYVYMLSVQYRFRKQLRISGSFKKGKLFKFSGTVASSAMRYFKSSCLSHSFSGNLYLNRIYWIITQIIQNEALLEREFPFWWDKTVRFHEIGCHRHNTIGVYLLLGKVGKGLIISRIAFIKKQSYLISYCSSKPRNSFNRK